MIKKIDHIVITTRNIGICFKTSGNTNAYMQELQDKRFIIELGVVSKNGVRGEMKSCYLRDPDGNLLEFASYE